MAREKPGYVTPVEIQKGIYYCIQNVVDILEDYNLLLENNRYTRALALSISALEEMGKISVLRSINRLPKNKQKLRSIEWNKFYEHQHKSSLGLFNTVRDEYKTTIDSIIFSASFVNEQAVLTEDLRQMALYTSYSASKKTWYSPREVDRETASRYFQTARAAFERIMQIRETGFFDANILQLEQQMYMEIYENLPDEPYDETTLRRISPLVKAKAKQLFDKLNEMGRIEESDVSFLD